MPGRTKRKPFTVIRRVRFGDVDFARTVYTPRYFEWFHDALEEFFEHALEQRYDHLLREQGLGLPAVTAEATFSAPLHFGDEVALSLRVTALGRTSVTFGFEVQRVADGAVAARGTSARVLVDLATLRPVPLPAPLRARLARHRAPAPR